MAPAGHIWYFAFMVIQLGIIKCACTAHHTKHTQLFQQVMAKESLSKETITLLSCSEFHPFILTKYILTVCVTWKI